MQPMQPTSEVDTYDLVSQTTRNSIDLDRAKQTEDIKTVGETPSSDMVQYFAPALKTIQNIHVAEDAVTQGMTIVNIYNIANYCHKAIQFDVKKLKSGKSEWTAEDLGWNDVV